MNAMTPAAELAGYREQRMAGTLTADEYMRHADRLGPLIDSGAQTSTVVPADQARTEVNELRQKRIDGKVTQTEFFAQMDKLGPVAHPNTSVSPDELAAVDRAMAAPDSGAAYDFEYGEHPPDTPQARAFDTGVREALIAAKLPAHVGSYAYSTANQLLERFQSAPAAEITAHVASVTSTLRNRWGADFKPRMDAVLAFVAEIGGPLGDMIERTPWMIADPLLLSQLDSVVQHRARKA